MNIRLVCSRWKIMLLFACFMQSSAFSQIAPSDIQFIRQGVQRIVFDDNQAIHLAGIDPSKIIGLSAMYPAKQYLPTHADISVIDKKLQLKCSQQSETTLWFGGFNPFATYIIDLDSCKGKGAIGYAFTDVERKEQFTIAIDFANQQLGDVKLKIVKENTTITDKSIRVSETVTRMKGKIILQLLGSGLTIFFESAGLPEVIAQADFSNDLDLRAKSRINTYQSHLLVKLNNGEVVLNRVNMMLSAGMGLADIRAITYENGDPMIDEGRIWYTMTVRGRALPHHIQGIFSLNPTVFDLKFEGLILFDREDGLLRNEVASHIYYDRNNQVWRGITTGFSAYAHIDKEKKQLLAVEGKQDPRKGFSIMKATPFGIVGDVEDPHILYDSSAHKWRILTCINEGNGYKAIMLESDEWNKGYKKIAGPVSNNSTGTSIQKIGNKFYCFSGSDQRKVFIYTYPNLTPAGDIKMDLPPWDEKSGTRVWPNIIELPEGYAYRYIALMMDRFNYPGLKGPNWSYGALYLYHGF